MLRKPMTPTQLLTDIDDRLARVADALREARGHDELANVAICEQRLEELLEERNRVAALIPKPRPAT